ncbi:MAG: glycosyltransferase family 2 protein [Candidatus Bathyarchaeota archaeon]
MFLNFSLLILVMLILTYVIRHYIFTIVVLFNTHKPVRIYSNEANFEPYISIMIPAHNEEHVIRRILQRMTELTYSKNKFEVIVIDDASTDRTYEIAKEFAKIYPFIKVVRRNANDGGKGKPEALNCGLKFIRGEIIYFFDADYLPQFDIVEKLTIYFRDPKVGAVQGRVTVLNEPSSLVTRLITLERIGGYRVDQFARNQLGLIPQFGGTVGGFRKTIIESLGGWDPDILAEDTDLTFKIILAGFKVKYVNEAECYEEAVEDWHSYWVQRSRWAKGHMQCAFKHLFPVIKSKNLCVREKIDGLLLLNIYFVPILVALAWILGVMLLFVQTDFL